MVDHLHWSWGGIGGIQIINLMVQEPSEISRGGHPGKASISHLDHALKELAKFAKKEGIKSIALPKLATGVGGLDWHDVSNAIHHYLGDLDIPIYVYSTYTKGQKAEEA